MQSRFLANRSRIARAELVMVPLMHKFGLIVGSTTCSRDSNSTGQRTSLSRYSVHCQDFFRHRLRSSNLPCRDVPYVCDGQRSLGSLYQTRSRPRKPTVGAARVDGVLLESSGHRRMVPCHVQVSGPYRCRRRSLSTTITFCGSATTMYRYMITGTPVRS